MALDADMVEIAQLFIEESMEGLDVIESSLLALDIVAVDPDIINEIFRAAHSIKGGGGTFGFVEISEFAHQVETLLDEIRQGERAVSKDIVDLILRAVDCMRSMIRGLDSDEEADDESRLRVEKEIAALLRGEEPPAPQQAATARQNTTTATDPDVVGWKIHFKPEPQVFRSGCDPIGVFAGLADLGDISVEVSGADELHIEDIDPEICALQWRIKVFGDVTRDAIDELFCWVKDECELKVSPIRPATPATEMLVIAPSSGSKLTPPPVDNAETKPAAPPRSTARKTESGSIRVGTDKVDALINLVGELVITQSILGRIGKHYDFTQFEALQKGLEQLSRNTRELQESVMQIRMMPISFAFTRFPRLVRDASSKLGKNVELVVQGEATELDKTVLEKIGDPLVHLVRNSLDHGIETSDIRAAAGKPEVGTLSLSAYHEGGNIVIGVKDDGAGIDREKVLKKAIERGLVQVDDELSDEEIDNLIFLPGFSTVDAVSELSGRGVGMDVVRRNIIDLGGHVSIHSRPGQGSTFTIRLPLTLAILDGQLIQVAQQTYIIPLISIVETVEIAPQNVDTIAAHEELFKLRGQHIPIIRLYELFGLDTPSSKLSDGLLVVVEAAGQRVGLFVDDLLEQQQVVIKSLEANFRQMQGIAGATILGDGAVALILDVRGLIDLFLSGGWRQRRPAVA